MQLNIDARDIRRLAQEIDSTHGRPIVDTNPIIVRFKGHLASFSRPEYKTEKLTYPVPTFSALRNMMQAIYWHPGFNFIPVACGIVNPIKTESIATNGIKTLKSAKDSLRAGGHIVLRSTKDVLQRTQTYLIDVEYIVIAFIVLRPDMMNAGDSANKFAEIFNRRVRLGQCAYRPSFGMRECPADFSFVDYKSLDGNPFINSNEDLGLMVFDFDYSDPDNKIPLFQHEYIKDGIVMYTGQVFRNEVKQ